MTTPAVTPTALDAARRAEGTGYLRRAWAALGEELAALHLRLLLVDLLVRLLPQLAFCRARRALYRLAGVRIGRGTLIFGRLQLVGLGKLAPRLRVGELCNINSPCFLDLNAEITIGDHVSIGHHTVFVTADHELGVAAHRGGPLKPRSIVIEDGCLIGACVTILPGARIGKSSVVAPGSVVTGEVPPFKLVGGVPARIVKALPVEP